MSHETDYTQLRAVQFEQDGDRHTVYASVHDLERRSEPELFGGERRGLYARLHVSTQPGERPTVRHMSRLVGEQAWVVDGEFAPNGFPRHNNGFGARYLRTHGLVVELDKLLNNAVLAQELAVEIGIDTPLVLDDESPED
ncbi:hypothetical protein [Streptomyces sp. MP131-18]|uniref:hypothetical protein n=1 Tax=Streptomyces sp. MP131-18 TaxID=1857892 RepID=UPI00097C8960|nr:hypothetical protein [Streptomyces sp. MP131-18]ONK13102.1 hypothetical protein STBA_38640 [Streptomyces sp. MP131-18]